ncbi:MAG: exodeoxyribonuclease VII large subunit [bacterium]|nr:exodeoxyribonuclease VII large subunit [bacterium]MCM1376004.1 exodeoxyribonuclease VII large subunit [Muribaculum sp.]
MARSVYTVTQVNAYIRNMFTQDYMLQALLVKGEVSNCKYHSSGHIYFTLKDQKGTLNCVMFSSYSKGLNFRMQEGQQVIVGGAVDVYERDGKYQLYARQIVLDGAGALYERYEQLKRELEEQGMFAPEYKQPIPRFVRTLGVVTADTGAAVRDIIQIASRRNPYVQILLYPAIVQGDQAADSIVRGIRALERQGVDVMIVGRGGGSIEDLWAFNERRVAQAVFDCRVPVISAVGHETDTTIIDFVADLRAPTPSAAAELAVYEFRQLADSLDDARVKLNRGMQRQLTDTRNRARQYELRLKAVSPGSRLREKRIYLAQLEERLQKGMQNVLREKRHRMAIYVEQLKGLSPLQKLSSGYSHVADERGKTIRSIQEVLPEQVLSIQVTDGRIRARVVDTEAIEARF